MTNPNVLDSLSLVGQAQHLEFESRDYGDSHSPGAAAKREAPPHLVAKACGPPQRQDGHQHLQEWLTGPSAVLLAHGHHGLHALQQALTI